MPAAALRIAAAQFPVSGDLARNARYVRRQMRGASDAGADVIHFPETALPGYAPKHLGPLEGYDWAGLEAESARIRALAASLGLWVVLGSMREVDGTAPLNSLHVISADGETAAVYDKRRLYGEEQALYSAGAGPCIVEIGGFRCGFLICYENCFPELYDEYRGLGVGLVFHSFYNAANSRPTSIQELMLASMIVRAADNRMWISAANSSQPWSPLAACIVRPDGSVVRARRNVTGLAIDDYPKADLGWTYDNRADLR